MTLYITPDNDIHCSPSNTELASVTPTTMASTTRAQHTTQSDASGATPLPLSTIIAIAVSAGVLFLAVAFIVIVTLLLCCLLYKKSKPVSAAHQTTNGNQYNSRFVNNVAYSHNDGVQLQNNASYNISDKDEPYYTVVHA